MRAWLFGSAGFGALALALTGGAALADDPATATVAGVTVTAPPGGPVDAAHAPYAVHSLVADDITRDGPASLTGALAAEVGAVNIGDDLDDPFQPDILYRGFEASPVLGTSEGLAVYQNGVRINEAFGDVVNWDLVPDDAVARVDVVGDDPVYGRNALGGAVAITLKNGFDDPGGAVSGFGGSFGQRGGSVSYGASSGPFAAFVSVRALDETGWREFSADSVRQAYADLMARSDRLTLDVSFTGADNRLGGESATPVQELAVDRRLVFTSPQLNADTLAFGTLSAAWQASPTLALQGGLYAREFRQAVANGNTTDAVACAALADQLCQSDGLTPLMTASGAPIPDLSNGGTIPIGENDRESLVERTYGGSLQATSAAPLFGRANHTAAGFSLEDARVDFGSSAELGVVDPALVVEGSGFFIDTPEGTPFTATPVSLAAETRTFGAFATDTLQLGRLSVTASGRWDEIRVSLQDQLGSALSGESRFARFNPAVGATWRLTDGLTAYAGYAEGSRAPTASEIECSDPAAPCLLPSSLSADPPGLRQVVSRTVEAGLRGSRALGAGRLDYSAGYYRTQVSDDIYGVATSLSAGFFQNIPGTRREGGELDVRYRGPRLTASLSYAYVAATFTSAFELPSPSNPLADGNGNIPVRPGDTLPGVPRSRLKLGVEGRVMDRLRIGAEVQAVGSQFFRGDEANLLTALPGYAVVGVHGSYALTSRADLSLRIDNAFDARYATFGVLGDATGVNAPGVPTSGPVDPRFISPAAPFSLTAELTARF